MATRLSKVGLKCSFDKVMSFRHQTLLSSLEKGKYNKRKQTPNTSLVVCKGVMTKYCVKLHELGILYFLVVGGWLEFPRNKDSFPSVCSLQGYQVFFITMHLSIALTSNQKTIV